MDEPKQGDREGAVIMRRLWFRKANVRVQIDPPIILPPVDGSDADDDGDPPIIVGG